MHLRHVALQQPRRLARRFPFLRRLSFVTTFLTLLWLYAVYWSERVTFSRHINACTWDKWEEWPASAAPHHLVFVADPQLVDPHTYPGRPWPLSTLTELYTDLYMGRNFKLINVKLDPDSIVFLGDLFDGGREWATSKARPLMSSQKKKLEAIGVLKTDGDEGKADGDSTKTSVESDEQQLSSKTADKRKSTVKRSQESYTKAILQPHDHAISKKDHFLTSTGRDLKTFVPGEDGRWSAWGQKQWDTDFARFGRIFFDPEQLYPHTKRTIFPAFEVDAHHVSIQNGAGNGTTQEYATAGGKQRRVLASLPGNHDIGFGKLVQWPVRDRFEMHFGETNQVTVIGNHTFISLDTPSLSAAGQFLPEGGETRLDQLADLEYIWKPTMNFLEGLRTSSYRSIADALQEYYPTEVGNTGYPHTVTHIDELEESIKPADKPRSPKSQLPVILLTHVPLYRDPDTDCGNLREKDRAIAVRAGYQYQNVVTKALTNKLVNYVAAAGDIVHVFSGDDHDYCDVTHRYNVVIDKPAGTGGEVIKSSMLRNVKEITVKSFSWAMGVRHPGFQLVSLWNPVDEDGTTIGTPLPTIQTHLCLLPDQLTLFIDYALLFGISLIVLLLRAIAIGLRYTGETTETSDDDTSESPLAKLVLPRYQSQANGAATRGRHRAASTSTSSNHNSNGYLGVQRSFTARTRSVSPALGAFADSNSTYGSPSQQESNGPLIEKAGYYPQVRWSDPGDADDDSDEESHVGALDGQDDGDDCQAKWKRRRRTGGKVRKAVGEFFASVLLVGLPAGLWYVWLVRHG